MVQWCSQLSNLFSVNISVVNDDVREFNKIASLVIIPQDPVDQVAEGNFTMIIIVDDGDGKIQSVTAIMLLVQKMCSYRCTCI